MEKILDKPREVIASKTDLNSILEPSKNSFLDLAKACKIDPEEEIKEAHVCLSIKEGEEKIPIASLGDFSLVIGKAKSKKTFSLVMFFASLIKGESIYNEIVGCLPESKKKVVFFDTEQSRFDTLKLYKRISRLLNIDKPENLEVYNLRRFSADESLQIIEAVIYNDPSIGFVGIDGARDLITDINNQSEATVISRKLLKWTEELNIHIMTVLHQNKGDQNARGHIGTELINKAQTVLAIEVDSKDKNISIIDPRETRGKSPNQIAFTINESGLPELISFDQSDAEKSKNLKPDELRQKQGIVSIFSKEEKQKHKDLETRIKIEFGIGSNAATTWITQFRDNGWILLNGKSGTVNAYYTIGDLGVNYQV